MGGSEVEVDNCGNSDQVGSMTQELREAIEAVRAYLDGPRTGVHTAYLRTLLTAAERLEEVEPRLFDEREMRVRLVNDADRWQKRALEAERRRDELRRLLTSANDAGSQLAVKVLDAEKRLEEAARERDEAREERDLLREREQKVLGDFCAREGESVWDLVQRFAIDRDRLRMQLDSVAGEVAWNRARAGLPTTHEEPTDTPGADWEERVAGWRKRWDAEIYAAARAPGDPDAADESERWGLANAIIDAIDARVRLERDRQTRGDQ